MIYDRAKKDYFILSAQSGNQVPRLLNMSNKLNVQMLSREHYQEIPPFFLLDMQVGIDIFYPDILFGPLLMVSRQAMDVIKMYDEKMPFIFMALYDREREESAVYYCPILCPDDSGGDEVLFLKTMEGRRVVIIRDDLAESLLNRGATGMHLAPLECI